MVELVLRIPHKRKRIRNYNIKSIVCPSCGEALRHQRGMVNKFCPRCEEALNDAACVYRVDHVSSD